MLHDEDRKSDATAVEPNLATLRMGKTLNGLYALQRQYPRLLRVVSDNELGRIAQSVHVYDYHDRLMASINWTASAEDDHEDVAVDINQTQAVKAQANKYLELYNHSSIEYFLWLQLGYFVKETVEQNRTHVAIWSTHHRPWGCQHEVLYTGPQDRIRLVWHDYYETLDGIWHYAELLNEIRETIHPRAKVVANYDTQDVSVTVDDIPYFTLVHCSQDFCDPGTQLITPQKWKEQYVHLLDHRLAKFGSDPSVKLAFAAVYERLKYHSAISVSLVQGVRNEVSAMLVGPHGDTIRIVTNLPSDPGVRRSARPRKA